MSSSAKDPQVLQFERDFQREHAKDLGNECERLRQQISSLYRQKRQLKTENKTLQQNLQKQKKKLKQIRQEKHFYFRELERCQKTLRLICEEFTLEAIELTLSERASEIYQRYFQHPDSK